MTNNILVLGGADPINFFQSKDFESLEKHLSQLGRHERREAMSSLVQYFEKEDVVNSIANSFKSKGLIDSICSTVGI